MVVGTVVIAFTVRCGVPRVLMVPAPPAVLVRSFIPAAIAVARCSLTGPDRPPSPGTTWRTSDRQ